MAVQEDMTTPIMVTRSVFYCVYPLWISVGVLLLGFFLILGVLPMNLLLNNEMDFRKLGDNHDSGYLRDSGFLVTAYVRLQAIL